MPDLKVHSVSRVLDKGLIMNYHKEKCDIVDSQGMVRAAAERQGKLFKMLFKENVIDHCNVA